MTSDSEPENFFSFDPPNPPGIKISTPTDPLGKHTETFKITNKIAFIMISKENLMTVVDRLDELQASSVGRRECSSTRQRTGARRIDVHVDT